MWVILDIETDSLTPTVIHCIVCKEVDSGKVHTFYGPDYLRVFQNFSKKISGLIGHNIINFDLPVLRKFIPDLTLSVDDCIDTLVVSRLLLYNMPGGHSLEAWGERLGFPKPHIESFTEFSMDIVKRCQDDVEINYLLYQRFLPYIESEQWKKALRLEHDTQAICKELHDNGFVFNKEKAQELLVEAKALLSSLDLELQSSFPPKTRLIKVITPKATKSGSLSLVDFRWLKEPNATKGTPIDLSIYTLGAPFSRIEWVEFNPGSHKQVVDILWEVGWNPINKTKGHIEKEKEGTLTPEIQHYGWKVDEENLETVPEDAPESIRKLIQRFLIANRTSTLEQWLSLTTELPNRSERVSGIRGTFNGIGSWTHRKSHSDPNMANAPSVDSKYKNDILRAMAAHWGHKMRGLFTVPKGSLLLGVDAEGIQLRILAHYMNDPEFTEALVNGDKDAGTDAHTLNARVLGTERPRAKTFIYAWLLGASVNSGKIPNILGCSKSEAKKKVEYFLEAYPGLKKLKQYDIPRDAANGYFIGLDGRLVACTSEHLMLSGYLQNGESLVMKTACCIWYDRLIQRERQPILFVDDVHDEWQTEINGDSANFNGTCLAETRELAEYVAQVQMDSIVQAGIELGVKCPLAGSYKIGTNWSETH